jgi:hypothetical protein
MKGNAVKKFLALASGLVALSTLSFADGLISEFTLGTADITAVFTAGLVVLAVMLGIRKVIKLINRM